MMNPRQDVVPELKIEIVSCCLKYKSDTLYLGMSFNYDGLVKANYTKNVQTV